MSNPQILFLRKENSDSRISLLSTSSQEKKLVRKRQTINNEGKLRSRSKERSKQTFQTFLKFQSCNLENTVVSQTSLHLIKDASNPQILTTCQSSSSMINNCGNFSRLRSKYSIQESDKDKKKSREPTPVKSRIIMSNKEQKKTIDSNQKIQLDLRMAELENELVKVRKSETRIKENYKIVELEQINLHQIIKQLEIQNKIILKQNANSQESIKHLQKAINESQNSLQKSKNTINSLRSAIKQNKIKELQQENKRLQERNHALNNKSNLLQDQNRQLLEDLIQNRKTLQKLKKQIQIERMSKNSSVREQFLMQELQALKKQILTSKSEKQIFLEEKMKEKNEEIFHLNSFVSKFQLQLHCLEKSKVNQLQEVKQNKQSQIKKLKVKYSRFVNELKEENNELKKAMYKLKNEKSMTQSAITRTTLFQRPRRDSDFLSLSPDIE